MIGTVSITKLGEKIIALLFSWARAYYDKVEAEKMMSIAIRELLTEKPNMQVVREIIEKLKKNGVPASKLLPVKEAMRKVEIFERKMSVAKKPVAKKTVAKKLVVKRVVAKRANAKKTIRGFVKPTAKKSIIKKKTAK